MHIFLTGDRQVGKSTLIKRILKRLSDQKTIRIAGFRTITVADIPDAVGSLYIVPAADENPVCNENNCVGIRYGRNKGTVSYPEVFDRYGTEVLKDAENSDLILMDELGRMETDSVMFTSRIEELLDVDIPILGVIQNRWNTPFLNHIRKHGKAQVVEVTTDNRDRLVDEITKMISI